MAYTALGDFPPQQLSFSRKNKNWRKACVDYGDNYSIFHHNKTRLSVEAMSVNYDLVRGIIHMGELAALINPYDIEAGFIPNNIQHYPIMNSKLEVLKGEESRRVFDYKVVVTNANAISEIENEKNEEINLRLQKLIADTSQSEEDFIADVQKTDDYFRYEYQDKRELRANLLLNHYIKELNISTLFTGGFGDAETVGEEIYLNTIVGGEPFVERIDPRKIRIIRSGNSTRVEDADMIVIEDYWSKSRVIDTYWDQLPKSDIAKIEKGDTIGSSSSYADSMGNINSAANNPLITLPEGLEAGDKIITAEDLFSDNSNNELLPYDIEGNIKVVRVFWKSRRKIKKVKSYDEETGEEVFNFYPETYIINKDKGEEEETFWVNEAWEGTKIGEDIYVNMGPRPIQYNRLSNPSRCHFGIIGSIYTNNGGDSPYSLVEIMKQYSYFYDIIHDRLNKTLAKNVGKVIRLDFAKVPKGWNAEKWLYYINVNGIAVENSFSEGDVGRSTGVLAGAMNNASSGVIDASLGNEIQQYVVLLDWISNKLGELAGISKQREGQISNRETVGGVERATLQSAYSTEWLFLTHEDVKRRELECLLETAKIALKGRKKKFESILSDGTKIITEIDGDEFAECDYGLIVDNSNGTQVLNQKLDMLGQAALQNQTLDFSAIMNLYTSGSPSEKKRTIENNEKRRKEEAERMQQQQMQMQQQQLQQQAQIEQQKAELQYKMHQEDLEAKILIAKINSQAEADRLAMMNREDGLSKAQEIQYKDKQLSQSAKEFSEKLAFDKQKHADDIRIKEKQLNNKSNSK